MVRKTAENFDDTFPITPSNTVDLTVPAELMIGTAGALKVITLKGNTVTLTSVPAGRFPVIVTRVFATGTAATNISGLV